MMAALVFALLTGCAPAMHSTAAGPVTPTQMAELWVDPADLESRDLVHGPGAKTLQPGDGSTFAFKELDTKGYSRGYDVRDPEGREWSVKLGPEAQSEIAASRLLWAVGYHQPPMYYVSRWTITGGPMPGPQPPGRFRPDLRQARSVADWSWQQNPFVGTRPFKGLVVLNLLINNWDLKTTNNKIYQVHHAADGPQARPEAGPSRWFVVRDLGAAFGKSRRFPYGTRNDVADFESQRFVTGVKDGRVQFDYHGRHRELLSDITPGDVTWACELVARLTDRQLDDGFRAAGYGEEVRRRFVRKLKSKVAEGLALREQGDEP
jgi:hypothetical protein